MRREWSSSSVSSPRENQERNLADRLHRRAAVQFSHRRASFSISEILLRSSNVVEGNENVEKKTGGHSRNRLTSPDGRRSSVSRWDQ